VPPGATHALLCLHGFGSDGHDLLTLAAPLQASLGKLGETLAVFCPHAPSPTPFGQGFQWFRDMGWTFRDQPGLAAATDSLTAMLREVESRHGIPPARTAVLGFSQGAMTLLHALPALPPLAGAISCAGALTVPPTARAAQTTPPLLFLHGTADDVLPADASVAAEAFFKTLGYPTQLHLLKGLGHGINPQALAHLSVFLQGVF